MVPCATAKVTADAPSLSGVSLSLVQSVPAVLCRSKTLMATRTCAPSELSTHG
jgi:hypothetical protein